MIRGIALVALVLATQACGGEPLGSDAEIASIVDGAVTTEFDAVVAITPRRISCGDSASVLCSGTLIAPNAVLSAAHCFASMRPGLAYEVFVGDAVGPDAQIISVVGVVTHPDFDEDTRDNDVAVLWLASSVDGVLPEALPAPDSNGPRMNDPVEFVGFGSTEPATPPDGTKRVGLGRVGVVSAGTVSVDPDPSVSCVGDSGGPLFASGETPELIGVASSGDTGCQETSVYALIAPTVDGFLLPTLSMGAPTRPAELDSCGATCTSDDECPIGFVCVPSLGDTTFHCALPGQEAGMLTDTCGDDSTCGAGFCTVGEMSPDCQCYEPCDATEPNTSSGCAVRHGAYSDTLMWLLALLLWIGIRSRS